MKWSGILKLLPKVKTRRHRIHLTSKHPKNNAKFID